MGLEDKVESFVRLIIEDVIHARNRVKEHSSAESRRNYVRTLVAGIEGMAWYYRDKIVDVASALDLLTKHEVHALDPFHYSINDSGRLKRQRQHPSAIAMIRFSARVAERIHPKVQHDFGVKFWEVLQSTITIRNGITHPKTVADLDVSMFDIDTSHDAFEWLVEFISNDLEFSSQALCGHNDAFGEVLSALRSGDPETARLYKTALREQSD